MLKSKRDVKRFVRLLTNASYQKHWGTFPRYLKDRKAWLKSGGQISHFFPILHDYKEDAGNARGHYFHQDLVVAADIFRRNPERHIDVGSRIDGFVAHVAAFRAIEVLDVRPLPPSEHPNILFRQADLMGEVEAEITESLSCLHALEHFGLGRYGDPITPHGHEDGVANLITMLKPDGTLYISFPIGKADEVHFNAHRVFDPRTLLKMSSVTTHLKLVNFDCVDDQGALHRHVAVEDVVGKFRYGCGIYTLEKGAR